MVGEKKALDVSLRFAFDKATAGRVRQGVISIEEALDELEESAYKSRDALARLVDGFQLVEIAGQQLTGIGQAILGPIRMGAEAYIMSAGRAEATSRRWLDASYELEKTQFRIGRAAAQAILPSLERAAELAEMAADFVQEHPGIIRAALKIGAVVAGLGAVGLAVTKGIRLYADVKLAMAATQQMLAARIMDKAAKQQLAAATGMRVGGAAAGLGRAAAGVGKAVGTVALMAGSVYIGGEIGTQMADFLGPSIYGAEAWEGYRGDKSGWNQAFETYTKYLGSVVGIAGVAGAGLADLMGIDTAKFRKDLADTVLSIGGLGESAEKAKKPIDDLAGAIDSPYLGQAVDAYISHTTEIAEMEYQLARERVMAQEQYQRDVQRTEESYLFQRQRTIRDFARDQAEELVAFRYDRARYVAEFRREEQRDEEEYYADRALRARDYGLEIHRMERDHQRDMLRSREDYEDRMRGIVADRDAFAAVEEMRSYEKERRQAEDDYRVQASERSGEYALEIQDSEDQFRKQRELRREDFALQQAEQQDDFDRSRALAEKHQQRMLTDMAEDHRRELAMMDEQHRYEMQRVDETAQEERRRHEAAFADQIRMLDAALLGERSLRNQYYAMMTKDLQTWLKGAKGTLMAGYPTRREAVGVSARIPTDVQRQISAGTYSELWRQAGGYVKAGWYRMHEKEFVLSRETTRQAEMAAGGPLTQSSFARGMSGHRVDLNIALSAPGLGGADWSTLSKALIPVMREQAGRVFEDVLIEVQRAG